MTPDWLNTCDLKEDCEDKSGEDCEHCLYKKLDNKSQINFIFFFSQSGEGWGGGFT